MSIFYWLLILILSVWQIPASAHTGVFLTATGGKAKQEVLRFSAGYIHDFNHYFGFGAEVGQAFYGQVTTNLSPSQQFKASSASNDFMAVVTTYWKRWIGFAEVGGNRRSITLVTNSKITTTTQVQPEVIAGIAYNLTQHIAAEIAYLHTFGKSQLTITGKNWIPPNLTSILAGIRINF